MKKMLFGLIATILISYAGIAQKKVKLVDLPGVETALIIDMKADNSFKEYYLLQNNNDKLFDITKVDKVSLIESNKDLVKIDCDGKIITFTIDSNYKNANETVYYGYGLSKRRGNFSLIINTNPVSSITENIYLNGKFMAAISCHSGGKGSSECSADSPTITGGGGCSVKCNAGYYSCCDDTKNECKCISEKTGGTVPTKLPLVMSPN